MICKVRHKTVEAWYFSVDDSLTVKSRREWIEKNNLSHICKAHTVWDNVNVRTFIEQILHRDSWLVKDQCGKYHAIIDSVFRDYFIVPRSKKLIDIFKDKSAAEGKINEI